MKKTILSLLDSDEQRIAVLKDGILVKFTSHTAGHEDRRNNIYRGIVEKIEPSLNACFVSIGDDKNGFLQFPDIDQRFLKPSVGEHNNFSTRLEAGQPLLVQIVRDSRSSKGPQLTTRLKLASNRVVLDPLPTNGGSLGISREADSAERKALNDHKDVFAPPPEMSLIVRKNGVDTRPELLAWEVHKYLLNLWERINEFYQVSDRPCLIYEDQNLINLCVRENLEADTDEMICETEKVAEQVRNLVGFLMPEKKDIIKVAEAGKPLFSDQILSQIDALMVREIRLPSGGALIFDIAEAMTVIDVNSGRARNQSNIENTALAANLEAGDEIARQLRLRNISGIIVIDFIDMAAAENQRKVVSSMKRFLRSDKAKINTSDELSFCGTFELTRQNIGRALHESNSRICTKCAGTGRTQTECSFALSILDRAREICLSRINTGRIAFRVPTAPATFLLNERRREIAELENNYGIELQIIPSAALMIPDFHSRVDRASATDSRRTTLSYEIEFPNDREIKPIAPEIKTPQGTAAISSYQPDSARNSAPPKLVSQQEKGRIFSWIKSIFGPKSVPVATKESRPTRRRSSSSTSSGSRRRRGSGGGGPGSRGDSGQRRQGRGGDHSGRRRRSSSHEHKEQGPSDAKQEQPRRSNPAPKEPA